MIALRFWFSSFFYAGPHPSERPAELVEATRAFHRQHVSLCKTNAAEAPTLADVRRELESIDDDLSQLEA